MEQEEVVATQLFDKEQEEEKNVRLASGGWTPITTAGSSLSRASGIDSTTRLADHSVAPQVHPHTNIYLFIFIFFFNKRQRGART
jgi:hypothetical protein